jgi:hypothetical protein
MAGSDAACWDGLPFNGKVASFGGICPHNKFSVSPDVPSACQQVPTTALPPSSPQVSAHRDRRRRHLYAHDGATHTPTTASFTRARIGQPGFSRGRVMVF